MKTTIEIADDLLLQVEEIARREKTTVRALTEQGLRILLSAKEKSKQLPPLPTGGHGGMTDEFKDAGWEKIRDEIYKGHGA